MSVSPFLGSFFLFFPSLLSSPPSPYASPRPFFLSFLRRVSAFSRVSFGSRTTRRPRTFHSHNNSGVPGEFSLPASISFHPPWHDSCRTLVIMRGESCVSHRGIIRKCFPRHSRPFLPRLPFFFSSRTFPLAFIIFYFVQLYARKYSRVMDFWCAQQLIRPRRLTSSADRRRSRGLYLPRLLPAALNAGRILASDPPPLARPFASLRSTIDMEGFFRAASFARLILRSRERNFHRAAAAGANSHGRSSIAKHPRESAFVSTDCV